MTTMQDVIDRSALKHPSLLAHQVLTTAAKHQSFAQWTPDLYSGVIAGRMAVRLRILAKDIGDCSGLTKLTLAETITLFDIAAELQGIPPEVAETIGQSRHRAVEEVSS